MGGCHAHADPRRDAIQLHGQPELELAIRETLRVRVIAPTDRVIAELEKGAKPTTAYFAITRFVIPNVLYHM